MVKKILIIHPEGNINNNPNLTGMVEILCENGFIVHIYSPKSVGIYQATPCKGAQLVLFDNPHNSLLQGYVLLAGTPPHLASKIVNGIWNKLGPYDLIIGVDRGIIEASVLAKLFQRPYGLISYEILFADETSVDFKLPEIKACQELSFAVCQDKLRGKLLAMENQIPVEKVLHIPFAGRFLRKGIKTCYLHDQLKIGQNKKIALLLGSVSEMCMVTYLIESAQNWPDDWVLVLHNRYGLDKCTLQYYRQFQDQPNLHFSLTPESDPNHLYKLLHSADLGIGLYRSYPNSIWLGKNISNLGMASGKISTYLQHGVPVLVNEIGELSDCVRKHELGLVVDDRYKIQLSVNDNDLNQWKSNCYHFFSRRLNLNQTIAPLLQHIQRITDTTLRQYNSTSTLASHPSQVEENKSTLEA